MPTAGVAVDLSLVDLECAGDHAVEHVAVMRDQEERAAILLLEIGLEPLDRVGVEVVGRFIEDGQGRLLDEKLGQGDPPSLSAAQLPDRSKNLAHSELLEENVDPATPFPPTEPLDFMRALGLLTQ